MIAKIEENDFGFCSKWSKLSILECGYLFTNRKLPNDPFFNKFTNVTCSKEEILSEASLRFRQNDTRPFFYVLNNPEFEDLLRKNGYVFYDMQHMLTKCPSPELENIAIHHIAKKDSLLWSEIFCNSFDCYDWIDEINGIVRNSCSEIQYLVDARENASCVALYEKNSILGLYCLGTLPDKRKMGLAKLLINYSLNQVKKNNLEFLILETYQRDNLLNFYYKLGFKKAYEKKIYTIPI